MIAIASGVTAISAGSAQTCAIVNGAAECWGGNFNGQLGNNSTMDSAVPVAVSGLSSGVTAISAGDAHTCAIVNGAAECWGFNGNGELGNGSTTDSHIPVIAIASGVTAISVGRVPRLRHRQRRGQVLGLQLLRPAGQQLHKRIATCR